MKPLLRINLTPRPPPPSYDDVVEVLAGPHAGKLGYLDDIDADEKVVAKAPPDALDDSEHPFWRRVPEVGIVYFDGHPIDLGPYEVIPLRHLRAVDDERARGWVAERDAEVELERLYRLENERPMDRRARARRAVGRCESCGFVPHESLGDTAILHAHHVMPRAAGGGDEDANLAVLCPNCHATAHRLTFVGKAGARCVWPGTKERLLDMLRRLRENPERFNDEERAYLVRLRTARNGGA